MKSALITVFAKGKRAGLNYQSAWEPLASFVYHHKYAVDENQHAIVRVRKLISQALAYQLTDSVPNYGLSIQKIKTDPYFVFLHGTTWATKHWPEEYWKELAKLVAANNIHIKLPWGNENEKQRAQGIASIHENIEVLPSLKLKDMAQVLANAKAIVCVDTGLGHLAAALNVPTISLHGPTNPELTGILGAQQKNLKVKFECAPCLARECHFKNSSSYPVSPTCFTSLTPQMVWSELKLIYSLD